MRYFRNYGKDVRGVLILRGEASQLPQGLWFGPTVVGLVFASKCMLLVDRCNLISVSRGKLVVEKAFLFPTSSVNLFVPQHHVSISPESCQNRSAATRTAISNPRWYVWLVLYWNQTLTRKWEHVGFKQPGVVTATIFENEMDWKHQPKLGESRLGRI